MKKEKVNIFWHRRDLRVDDNKGFFEALKSENKILSIFIFDENILSKLKKDDKRVSLIYNQLLKLNEKYKKHNSSLLVLKGKPKDVFSRLVREFEIEKVFTNEDFEPYGQKRDKEIETFLQKKNIDFEKFTDHVLFHPEKVLKDDKKPYTVFTAYKNKYYKILKENESVLKSFRSERKMQNCLKFDFKIQELEKYGFELVEFKLPKLQYKNIRNYDKFRDFPEKEQTTNAGLYLRFGLVSVRKLFKKAVLENEVYLSELVWREFFIQLLYHFPFSAVKNFKKGYDNVEWLNDKKDFQNWKDGKTGYIVVDSAMRMLNKTGTMHNRQRMIVASFLTKHLLIDWKKGERYFAEKLLDYELASNVGNWQWIASTGADSVPYFRIFNPEIQKKKFFKNDEFFKKWIEEFGTEKYSEKIVEHSFARKRAIEVYRKSLSLYKKNG